MVSVIPPPQFDRYSVKKTGLFMGGGGGADAKHRWHQNLTYQGAICSFYLHPPNTLEKSIHIILRPLHLPDHQFLCTTAD